MARYAKRRSHKKSHRRRRRVGAMSLSASSPLMLYGSIALGYFMGGKILDPLLTKVTGTLDPKIVGAGKAGLGFLLAFKGKKNLPKTLAGGILLGDGLKSLLTSFGVVTGYGAVPVVGSRRRLNGYGAVPVVGGYTGGYTPSQMIAGPLNGMGANGYNGYQAPPVPRKGSVVGAVEGSGRNRGGEIIDHE